jgi:tetratricopeptide (TPR) repeat protein
MSESSQLIAKAPTGALWIYNPWLDLIVGCGAWSAPLLLLTYVSLSSNALLWSVAFYGLALVFNYPHYMATIYRVYHREADFNRYRIFTVHITFLALLTVVLSHFWMRALPWIFTLYLSGSPWHYSGQNYGLLMMFARRAGAKPERWSRHAIYATFLLSYAILVLSFNTGPSADPLFLSLNLPIGVSSKLLIIMAVLFVGCSAAGLSNLIQQAGWRGMVPSLTLFATQFIWFLLPTALAFGEGLHIPQNRYSMGVLAVMHSAQYLWITSYYARREAHAEGRENWRPIGYFAVLIAGGIALFIPGPWIATHVFHFDFTQSFLIFTALVNIHHFILDGAIWKLRDGRIAALLINTQVRTSEAARRASSRAMDFARWVGGGEPRARALRIGLAATLLAWGTLDQVHYYLALHRDNLADLQRAAKLVAFDASVQLNLAKQEVAAGETDAAVVAWKEAIAASPLDPAPRNAYLQYLTNTKQYGEAYGLTRAALQQSPHDAQLELNHGILALQIGHEEEAVQSWQGALADDPHLAQGHLLLGAQFVRQGKPAEAISHYERYLEAVASQGPQNRPPASQVITVALSLADCQNGVSQPEAAAQTFDMARRLAFQTKESKLESLASVGEAAIDAHSGNTNNALILYQRALYLDDTAHDAESEVSDLYAYAAFLEQTRSPADLAYAVLLRADVVAPSAAARPLVVAELRKTLEQRLGAQAARLRRNSQAELAQALSMTRSQSRTDASGSVRAVEQ